MTAAHGARSNVKGGVIAGSVDGVGRPSPKESGQLAGDGGDRHLRPLALADPRGVAAVQADLRADDIPTLATRALAEAHPDYPVPRIVTRVELEAVIRQMLPR